MRRQEVIGIKEVGLVEYRFQPDSFEVRHVRAPGQIDVDLESLLALVPSGTSASEFRCDVILRDARKSGLRKDEGQT